MTVSDGLSFSRLAAAFEQLERTSSRKQLTTILADLLREVDADAIAEVAYLLQGRVAPLYEPVEFGLGERSVEKAVADVYGVEPAAVRQHYARVGDLGLVVAELAADSTDRARRSVREVFDELRRLAAISGSGSAEGKLAALRALLADLDPISAKHLVRIPLGASRLGVGDATILAAFNEARLSGTKPGTNCASAIMRSINASTTDIAARVRDLTAGKGADIVFNTVGDPYFEAANKSLALAGRQILIAAVDKTAPFNILEFYRGRHTYVGIDTLAFSSIATGDVLREALPGFVSGHLKPYPIAGNAIYSLTDAKAAYLAVSGSSRDRIILKPQA